MSHTPTFDDNRSAPPRLVLRFAIATCIGLALAACAILLVVRHFSTVQAERGATVQARVMANSVLRGALLESDFAGPVDDSRQRVLDELFEAHVLDEGVLRANLYAESGTVTYSTDHRLIGSQTSDHAHLQEAHALTIRGDVTTIRDVTSSSERKALRVYAPVAVPGGTGVAEFFQDYAPIADAAQAAFLPVAGIFQLVLLCLLVALAPLLRSVTRRIRRQMDEIEYRALYDELTGLPNRTLFRDRIQQAVLAAKRESDSATVLLLDVDRFREINDTLGHEAGDLLLTEITSRLRPLLRESDTFARLSGDDFGVLLPTASVADATLLAERVHESLEEPFALRGLPLEIGTSIGIASYPEHGEDVDMLLQRADVAMYVAKDAHAGTAAYDVTQDTNDAARLALVGELRKAIEKGELIVHYMPKADLQTGRVVGVEALVCWEHPQRGFIPPDDFVPLAERTGLIKPLTRHVLASSVEQCGRWRAAGIDLHVAVNLTIPDLLDLELPDRIAALLEENGVDAEQLELEITETTILADPFRVRQVLTRLNEMGLGLAVDDFGTGYSSLAYLRRLPVQTIKIDRSFVTGMCDDPNDATIVRSTIDLGKNLGLTIVAEGVESQDTWDALRALGCSLAQGYLIGRPMPAHELPRVLDMTFGVDDAPPARAAAGA